TISKRDWSSDVCSSDLPAINNPQMTFILIGGAREPLDVMVLNTYVAESADVIKKIKIKIIPIVLVINPNGKCSNIANNANSTFESTIVANPPAPSISIFNADPPNTLNHSTAMTAGTSNTPEIN